MNTGRATVPLRAALAQALPERPFRVELWDGSALPATNGGGPTFRLRSPRALGHLLRAPGQLGLGRAYVSGDIDVDDIDAVLELLDGYAVPLARRAREGATRGRRRARRRFAAGASRARGRAAPPRATP